MSGAALVGMGYAVPPVLSQRDLWDGFFAGHYAADPMARRLWEACGVNRRHGVVNPVSEDVSGWTTAARMARYQAEALPLGKEAVAGALADARLDAAEVGLFVVASCTGYATPGVDIHLARDLGMPADTQRLVVGHMGCYAALPGLGAATDFVRGRGRPAVLLCVELTSLHLQPSGPPQRDQVVAHALFADAAAAVVLRPAGDGIQVLDVVAHTDPATSDQMTWEVTDLGFRMGLSPRVPEVLGRHVRPVVEELLGRHGLARTDVDGWAVHPGGPRILAVVGAELGLAPAALEPSYAVLRDYGNCSSATVLLVLERLRSCRTVILLAFGPGLTLYAALLRRS